MKKNIGLWIGIVIVAVLVFVFWQSKTTAPTNTNSSVRQDQQTTPEVPSVETSEPITNATTPSTGEKKAGFTVADVAVHNNQNDCYTIVGDGVYGVTDWVSKHPGGAEAIIKMCGVDATELFTKQHGSFEKAKQVLASYRVGDLLK